MSDPMRVRATEKDGIVDVKMYSMLSLAQQSQRTHF